VKEITAHAPRVTIGYGAGLFDNDGSLDSTYRNAIAHALPSGVAPPEEWWRELAAVLADYYIVQERDAARPPELIREAMRNIGDLIDSLGKELRTIRHLPLSSETGDAIIPLLAALAAAKAPVERDAKRFGKMVAADRGHDPHRTILYGAVINLWDQGLGRGLRCSRGGPLARFFRAVVGPVLGEKMPGDSRIGGIVSEHKKRTYSDSPK
jgi:hypothetical protein